MTSFRTYMPSIQVGRTLIISGIQTCKAGKAEASIEAGDRYRLMQECGHSFLIRLAIRPPLPIVDLPREIAESPCTPFVPARGRKE